MPRPRRAEGRGRLIEEQDLGIGDQRLGDFEKLSLGQTEETGWGVGEQLEVEIEVRQKLARPFLAAPERWPLVGWRRQIEVVLNRLACTNEVS